MIRIAIGGFFHETNTFAPYPADLETFKRDATFPGLCVGDAIFGRFRGLNIGVSGALEVFEKEDVTLVPTAWASAVPSGPVTKEAFEEIGGRIVDEIARAAPELDGAFIEFHGAMVAEHIEHAETELVARLRQKVGDGFPIASCFDLHANLTAQIAADLDVMAVYRTYPHVDMADTGRRAARLLLERVAAGQRFHHAFRKVGFLVPLHVQCTDSGPGAAIYDKVRQVAQEPGIATVEFAFGFPPSDVAQCGPAIYVAGTDRDAVEGAADRLEIFVNGQEASLALPLYAPAEAVREARKLYSGKPIVISDTQDNPGAGGAGDTVGMLRALIEENAQNAVFAILHDPASSAQAHELGAGAVAEFRLGAHSGSIEEQPVRGIFTVEAVGDGNILAVGPMFGGNRWKIGRTALLRQGGVRVIVAERRLQAADTAILRHVGLEPEKLDIIVLKSSVHFRADFAPRAGAILVAAAPGLHLADNSGYEYRRLRAGVRRMPAATNA